jgi:type IV pilus assembly protein PilW
MRTATRHAPQQGISLVELLVSVVIGMMVVVVVVLAFLGAGRTQRRLAAMTQMNEEAQLALNFIKREVQMAGAMEPVALSATSGAGFKGLKNPFRPLYGCDSGFNDPKADFAVATCKSGVTTSHALESNYQALLSTMVIGALGNPMDCAGYAVTLSMTQAQWNPSIAANAAFVSSRLYVDPPSGTDPPQLKCAASNSGSVVLADNVESMTLWFGLAPGWSLASPQTKRPVRFVNAGAVAANDWGKVVAVRVCLGMRSAEAVLGKDEDAADYRDCDGAMKTSTDGRLRNAFFATATVRNRVGF